MTCVPFKHGKYHLYPLKLLYFELTDMVISLVTLKEFILRNSTNDP